MRRALVLVLAMAGTAHAQAPGMTAPQPQPPSVMEKRWAVAADLALESVSPDGGSGVPFGVFETAGRFRIRPEFEVGLSLDLGSGDGGDMATWALYADIRYRVPAEHPWNLVLLGSLGAIALYGKTAPDVERKPRGTLRTGIGVERRFGMFAVEADLKIFLVGQNNDVPLDPVANNPNLVAHDSLTGVSIGGGARFYF
jgi:hypothetical protein